MWVRFPPPPPSRLRRLGWQRRSAASALRSCGPRARGRFPSRHAPTSLVGRGGQQPQRSGPADLAARRRFPSRHPYQLGCGRGGQQPQRYGPADLALEVESRAATTLPDRFAAEVSSLSAPVLRTSRSRSIPEPPPLPAWLAWLAAEVSSLSAPVLRTSRLDVDSRAATPLPAWLAAEVSSLSDPFLRTSRLEVDALARGRFPSGDHPCQRHRTSGFQSAKTPAGLGFQIQAWRYQMPRPLARLNGCPMRVGG